MASPPSNRTNRSRVWISIVVVLILGAGMLYLLLPSNRDRVVVRWATAQQGDVVKPVPTNGRVEPLADFQPRATAPSTVEQVWVRIGQKVTRGQRLLELDASDAELRVANARNSVQVAENDLHNLSNGGTRDEVQGEHGDLERAQSEMSQADKNLASLEALQAKGAASASEVASAQQRAGDVQIKMNQVQARLKSRYGTGDVATGRSQATRAHEELVAAQAALGGLNLHSPIAGTVYNLPIARYDYINAGQTLIGVADLDRLQVRAFFDEPVIGSLANGQAVKIVWDAKPDHVWHGHVTQAPTTITNVGSRNVGECLISVDDATGDLLPNTNVTVTVTTMQRFGVLSLPREALHTEGANNFVYRIVAGKLVRTAISVGVVSLTRIEVTGGLKTGDIVALGATTDTDLRDGLAVRTQP